MRLCMKNIIFLKTTQEKRTLLNKIISEALNIFASKIALKTYMSPGQLNKKLVSV